MSSEKLERKVNFLTNMIFFVVVLLFVVVRICSHYGLFSFLGEYGSYILSIVIQVGLIFALPFVLLKVTTKSRNREVAAFCCYKKTTYKIVIFSVVLGLAVFFLNVYVSSFFNNLIERFGYKHSQSVTSQTTTWWGLVLNLICTAVLPAICEETLCRGLLLNGNSMLGIKKSVLISGFLFGLLHLNIEQFFYATLIGLFLAYVCWGCGSIYPCIIVHFMNNALSVFLNFASAKGWAIGSVFDWISKFVSANGLFGFLVFFFALCLLFYFVFYMAKVMFVESFKTNFIDKEKEFAAYSVRRDYLTSVSNIKNTENVADLSKEIDVLNGKTIENFTDKNFEVIIKHAVQVEGKQKTVKMSGGSKIFLFGSIALSAIVTILTFVWGIL